MAGRREPWLSPAEAAVKRSESLAQLRGRLRGRLRALEPRLMPGERMMFRLLGQAVEETMNLGHRQARWALRHLSTLVKAFEDDRPVPPAGGRVEDLVRTSCALPPGVTGSTSGAVGECGCEGPDDYCDACYQACEGSEFDTERGV